MCNGVSENGRYAFCWAPAVQEIYFDIEEKVPEH